MPKFSVYRAPNNTQRKEYWKGKEIDSFSIIYVMVLANLQTRVILG